MTSAAGRIVVLNGTSSAGKSTLATSFRDARAAVGDYWMVVGIDDVLSKLPLEWVDLGLARGPGPHARDGVWFESTPEGQRLRLGSLGRLLLHVYHATAAEAARCGMNVIVDDVVVDRETLADWHEVLDGLATTWVAVRCDVDVAEARELARGDRPVGMARAQHDVVHLDIDYAFEIDCGLLSPAAALDALLAGLGFS